MPPGFRYLPRRSYVTPVPAGFEASPALIGFMAKSAFLHCGWGLNSNSNEVKPTILRPAVVGKVGSPFVLEVWIRSEGWVAVGWRWVKLCQLLPDFEWFLLERVYYMDIPNSNLLIPECQVG